MTIRDLPSLPFDQRSKLPKVSAIYFVVDSCGSVVYIGQTYNLNTRWKNHHHHARVKQGQYFIHWLILPIEELNVNEAEQIAIYSPEWNGTHTNYNGKRDESDGKIRVVLYEVPDRMSRIDELCRSLETSRSALYRRAMREMLDRQSKKETAANDHE